MIYLKWLALTVGKFLLLPTVPFAAVIVPLFTREMDAQLGELYTWGGWWGTHDNPPQGDRGWVTKRCPFPNVTTGLKGYINRVGWLWRNKLYGYNALASVKWSDSIRIEYTGNPDISDKYKVPGRYIAYAFEGKKLVGFELYAVLPYTKKRNVRIRLGWKILTRKFEEYGFAQLVTTFNPVDGYGND